MSNRLQIVRGACPHDCPDTCSFEVSVDPTSGRAVKINGDAGHATTAGFLCLKVNHYLDRTYSDRRVLHPMRRVGKKGEGAFEQISWDEALDTIARRFAALPDPESILPYSYGGTLGLVQNGSMDHRFFHALGASQLLRTICAEAGSEALQSTLGWKCGPDFSTLEHSKLILIWGSNTLTSNVHAWPFIKRARDAGARLVVIDPVRTRTAERADKWVPIRPGTDGALALGMMHVIFRDGLEDRAYLEAHTEGWEKLAERVAHEWSPPRAALVTGLEASVIESLAHAYAQTRPAAIRLNYGLQRHAGGGAAVRAIVTLPAVVGSWREAGGGALLSTSRAYPVNRDKLAMPELMPKKADGSLPREVNMTRLGEALDTVVTNTPPVKALFVYASNPAAIAPDQERVLAGLAREDLFTVVHEIFETDTAKYADILLPATTQLEQIDIHKSYGHLDVLYNHAAIAPLGEAVSNTELFRRLAARMGLDDACFSDSDASLVEQAFDWEHPRMQGVTLDKLKNEGPQRLNVAAPFVPFADGGFFEKKDGRCLIDNPALAELGLDPLVGYTPPAEIGDGESPNAYPLGPYPLSLISAPAHAFLNSSFANLEFAKTEAGSASVVIHPHDASSRGVRTGDPVRIENARGAFFAIAEVSEAVRPGVVSAPSVFWLDDTPSGRNANAVTGQALTDMGEGATFYDCAVQVVRV